MKIGKIELLSDAILAPIAGFTDVGFRDIAERYGCQLTFTEMVSCKGIIYESDKTKQLLAVPDSKTCKGVQIFGSDPDIMCKAIVNPVFDKFDIIDINMGCPVPKIVKNGEGSALLNNPKLAHKIVKQLVACVSGRPITVKTRIGFQTINILDFAKTMEDAGVSALTVHGRTREQYYSGKADWDTIAEVVNAVKIPVIANGDVLNYDSYKKIKEHTKASGVMIARGSLGNLQLFKEIVDNETKIDTLFKTVDVKRDILMQIDVLKHYYEEHYIYSNMKKQICYYVKGMAFSRQIKDRVCRVESIAELINVVNEIF